MSQSQHSIYTLLVLRHHSTVQHSLYCAAQSRDSAVLVLRHHAAPYNRSYTVHHSLGLRSQQFWYWDFILLAWDITVLVLRNHSLGSGHHSLCLDTSHHSITVYTVHHSFGLGTSHSQSWYWDFTVLVFELRIFCLG